MIEIYRASHPVHAHLLKGLLQAEGIEAVVMGEFAFNVRGEAPLTTDTLPRVCVVDDEDAARARQIAVAFDRGRSVDGPSGANWRCPRCGETIEGQFAVCWKCADPANG